MSYNLPCWYYIIFNVEYFETILTLWITHSFCIWILVRLNLIFIFRYIFISIIYFLYDILIFCYYTICSPIERFHTQGYFYYSWLTKNKYYPSSSFLGYKKINFFPGFIRCVIDRIQYTVTHKSLRTFYKRFLRKSISSKRSTLERRYQRPHIVTQIHR